MDKGIQTTLEEPSKEPSEEQPQKTAGKKKITIEVDEDDPCLRKHEALKQTLSLLGKPFDYDPRCVNDENSSCIARNLN